MVSQQPFKLDHALLSGRFPHFTFQITVCDMDFIQDSSLTLLQPISKIVYNNEIKLETLMLNIN